MLGVHSQTCPELVMTLNNKLMVQFILKHIDAESNTEVDDEIRKYHDLLRSGFGTEHCAVKEPGLP